MARQKYRYLTVKRSASGLGLFATQTIPVRTRIIEYTGRVVSEAEAEEIGGRYLFRINSRRFIDGSPRSNLARYLNHSCEPNARAYLSGKRIWIWSIRTIEAGEEITIDYGKEYFEQFIKPQACKCDKCNPNPGE